MENSLCDTYYIKVTHCHNVNLKREDNSTLSVILELYFLTHLFYQTSPDGLICSILTYNLTLRTEAPNKKV